MLSPNLTFLVSVFYTFWFADAPSKIVGTRVRQIIQDLIPMYYPFLVLPSTSVQTLSIISAILLPAPSILLSLCFSTSIGLTQLCTPIRSIKRLVHFVQVTRGHPSMMQMGTAESESQISPGCSVPPYNPSVL